MKEFPAEEVMGLHNGARLVRALAWAPDTTEIVLRPKQWDGLVSMSAHFMNIRFDRLATRLEVCHAGEWYRVVPSADRWDGLYVNGDCVVRVPLHD